VDLIHFGQINKAACIVVTNYNQLNFDVRRVLSPYFSEEETKSFRQLQITTGTIISGSTALQLFDRATYPESDLDIYVEHRYRRDVGWWLMNIGYEYKPIGSEQPSSFAEALRSPETWAAEYTLCHGVTDIFNFFKAGSKRKVQLISTRRCTMEVILNFHSSMLITLIIYGTAGSMDGSLCYECYNS
jgi:hypothetical protein